jgi:aryl-alcohol dehydrogenase-like predicted oxidoreductase
MFPGSATSEGTARFAQRFPSQKAAQFYRSAQGLSISSIGIGTYLGSPDQETNWAYTKAIETTIGKGANLIDTSLNYRNQQSELAIGAALNDLIARGEIQRDEVVVCTKAGYLVPKAVPEGVLTRADIAGGMHCMAPVFLGDQLKRSRHNLGLETIDVFYLHNPETQLTHVSYEEFYSRIRGAFSFLETAVAEGTIRYYGTATWDGYRRGPDGPEGLKLRQLVQIATELAGAAHHFRFIQLPFNFGMPEAFMQREDGWNILTTARELGITVVASASLLQARLASDIPENIAAKFPGCATDAQRAIQFTRSTPGIAVALVGMSHAEHVRENLALANTPPMTEPQYLNVYKTT